MNHCKNSKPQPATSATSIPKVESPTGSAKTEKAIPEQKGRAKASSTGKAAEAVSVAEVFIAAVSKIMNPKAVAIVAAETPADVATVLKENLWGLLQLSKAAGEVARACEAGNVEDAAGYMKELVHWVGRTEAMLEITAAHYGVNMEEIISVMARVNGALFAQYERETEAKPQLLA